MSQSSFLQIAYGLNILILVPVCMSLFFSSDINGGVNTVFEGKVEASWGLLLLVGSLWSAILIASIMGLFQPQFFAPVLIIQIIYKALWLILFVAPLYWAGGAAAIPTGISYTFAAIVVTYPFLFWLGTRS